MQQEQINVSEKLNNKLSILTPHSHVSAYIQKESKITYLKEQAR